MTVSDVFDRLVAAFGEYMCDVGTAGSGGGSRKMPRLLLPTAHRPRPTNWRCWRCGRCSPTSIRHGTRCLICTSADPRRRARLGCSRFCPASVSARWSARICRPRLFRTLHDRGGTLLARRSRAIERGAPEVAELRSILLAGYKRGGKATRLESVGDKLSHGGVPGLRTKAIACINGVTGALATSAVSRSRCCAATRMPRRKAEVSVRIRRLWQSLRDDLYCC